MKHLFLAFFFTYSLFALDLKDEQDIQTSIENYAYAWNERNCHGFADDFTDDADFVNIFGMHFSGSQEIEKRHIAILETFLNGTKLGIGKIDLREVQPGLVIASVYWSLEGYEKKTPSSPDIEHGIFSHVFIQQDGAWKICSTQNTLITRPYSKR